MRDHNISQKKAGYKSVRLLHNYFFEPFCLLPVYVNHQILVISLWSRKPVMQELLSAFNTSIKTIDDVVR